MTFTRQLFYSLKDVLSKPTTVIHVLIGPRQVGKTTIARQIQESVNFPVIYASADSPVPLDAAWIETQWNLAQVENKTLNKPTLLILDEVQKVKGWSETLKTLWDSRSRSQEIRVLILGSSSLLMQEGLTESLAGRFYLHRCNHWNYTECKTAFGWNLEKWLFYGGYPGAASFVENENSWKRYITDSLIETVVARDVLQMSKITKPVLLRHLFALAAALPAQCVSYTKMLGQLHDAGNTTTLAHYLKLLESAFLVSGLELFSRNKIRKRGSSPKLVLWNNALVNALSTKAFNQAIADTIWWGRLVENAVGAALCNNLNSIEYSITYWRQGNYEVDYIVTRGPETWAIEVKSGLSKKVNGLTRFLSLYSDAKPLIIGRQGIPLEEFFSTEPQNWLK
ncbi:MAG: hypothetical protein APR62_05695 [Smithella sp. SDB]|nr:MAG: hypothetical protein APR62_05695 [Smithella sp. SDB]